MKSWKSSWYTAVEFVWRLKQDFNYKQLKNCDNIEKYEELKDILGQSLKFRITFQRWLNVIIKSIMSEMRTNTNVKEILREENDNLS